MQETSQSLLPHHYFVLPATSEEVTSDIVLALPGITKEGGPSGEINAPVFKGATTSIAASSPIHQKDLSEISYSDFIRFNYGQPYQKQYSAPITARLKKV